MMWGISAEGRCLAEPRKHARCPSCNGDLVAKCGEYICWHWAHKAKDCDHWSEPESVWHRNWKARFPSEWQERIIGAHRADVLTPRGIIEFQKSAIKPADIRERESFYGRMAWVLDASGFTLDRCIAKTDQDDLWRLQYPGQRSPNLFDLIHRTSFDHLEEYRRLNAIRADWLRAIDARPTQNFWWLWPHKAWLHASRKVFLDTGSGFLLRIDRHWRQCDGSSSKIVISCKKFEIDKFVSVCSSMPTKELVNA